MRNGGLQGIEAVVQWQKGMSPKCNDHRLLFGRKNGRARGHRPHGRIQDEAALAPLGHGLWLRPYWTAIRFLSGAFDRCIAVRMACVVVALPWSTCPTYTPGLNT